MGVTTGITWCHHTFNPWRGCTKVSDGCKFCYADQLSKRNPGTLGVWGPNGERVIASAAYMRQPFAWDRAAAKAGERRRVFCASMADVFEGDETMPASSRAAVANARRTLFDTICRTTNLDWLLLTKRPENALRIMVDAGLYAVANPELPNPQPNLWIGTSIENQATADERTPKLLGVPAAVRFLSCEPLLGPIKFDRTDCDWMNISEGVDWVIVGCESRGPRAGRFAEGYVEAALNINRQCRDADVPVFNKQMPLDGRVSDDPSDWPEDMRAQEFPVSTAA